ncbi:MAG: GNAT family N-acetyltransferase [Rhodoferax sp.]|nr:GNAT family N-acetyltransferase [Rhodoferax sp.]
MSIRNLDHLLDPASVAVFGASSRAGSVGATVWNNLRSGGFQGPVYPVNPNHATLDGETVFARASDLPAVPDLAVICTPAAVVPGLIAELAACGTRAAIVLTAGLDAAQRKAMLDAARPSLLRILGPNCIGMLSPHQGLNASFAHTSAAPGEIAFVSQSGALVTAMLDWARARAIGFSHFVSLGEHADVDFGDMLDYLASDAKTRAILLYIESIEAPRKFMSAARAAARNKPVIVVKAGRSAQGQKAAASHTGALAGSDLVYEAAIARAGMLRVDTLQQLFLAAETLTRFRTNPSDQLTILTNGGGAGVMAADAAENAGIALATPGRDTLAALDRVLPANWSHGNPVDIIGDAPVDRYVQTLQVLQQDRQAGAILFIHAPTAIVPSQQIAQALVPLADRQHPRLLSCWLGEAAVADARKTFQDAGIASYDTPEEAVSAFAMLVRYRRNQAQLLEAPAAEVDAGASPDRAAVHALLESALAQGRPLLTEPQAKAVLDAYRIPVVATRIVPPNADEAASAAQAIGFPVVLKILSDDISHKSDVGGVVLDLAHAAAVREAAAAMLARVARERPQARVDGFTVQAMVRPAHARELIVGASIDAVFGPVILFGSGGTSVEVVADRAIALPPLNSRLARALVRNTRVARLLDGFRDTPAANLDALDKVLVAVSQLMADHPQIIELDINPLILGPQGAIALDARIRVDASRAGGAEHFAIKPYPAELAETIEWNGRSMLVRPIRPGDEEQHLEFLAQLDPEDVRMRVFYSRRSIEPSELARLTQIDYEREIAFVAESTGPDGRPQTLAAARAVTDPDNIDAEFGIIVRSDLKGQGLGRLMMDKLIRTLRAQGTQRLVATVLNDNKRMLALQRDLGFVAVADPDADGTRAIALDLQRTGAAG